MKNKLNVKLHHKKFEDSGMLRTIFLVVLSSFFLHACSPVKDLGPDEYLLNKNVIKSNNKEIAQGAKPILKQKPNRKILGIFRFHLGVYNLANKGKQTRFKKWVKKTIGEEPVVLEPALTIKSKDQVLQYMQNEGYFNATISDSTEFKKRKKANVIYTTVTGEPYRLKNVHYEISDHVVKAVVLSDSVNSLLKSGKNFRTADFGAERDRVTKLLRNFGYYDFNQLYITFDIDSALKSRQVDVIFKIAGTNNDGNSDDTLATGIHKIYRINKVFIQSDYDPLAKSITVATDTTIYNDYYFLSRGKKLKYRPEALLPRIFIESGDLYQINNADYTYRGLANLSLFRFVNISYEPVTIDSLKGNWVNSKILLSPSPRQDYKIEFEGTHNGGNFGIGGNFTYRNKNLFRAAESFELKFRAKAESIPDFIGETEEETQALNLNTFEFGPEVTFRIPRFLWPLQKFNHIRSSNPTTLFSISYNYQKRPEYQRNLLLLSAGIEFRETKYKRHFISPAEINFSDFDLNPSFQTKLDTSNDETLKNYYKPYLITNGRYTFIYNTQELNILKNFTYLRFSFEIAGNSMRLIDKYTQNNYSDTSSYDVLEIKYSQYVRPDLDVRFYQVFSENSSLVYRFSGGIGVSYLNSDDMPYEKTFFSGGVNDLRAFKARRVGPGAFKPINNNEQLGDIKLNANIEYRSDIFKILEGAVFLDAGNVWFIQENENQPGGKFTTENFLSEVALGTGLGLRLDFNFFIFRVDAGVPLRDPSYDKNERWVIDNFTMKSVNYNFGIGYPF